IGEYEKGVIEQARRTKDEEELALMADVGRRATEVVAEVVKLIRSSRGVDGVLVGQDGKPLTIGAVKALIRREVDARGLEHPGRVIFAQGRDAGIPHADGEEGAVLRLGEPIVLDFFPRDRHTGYVHDMPRTLVPGAAPGEVPTAYCDSLGAC